ncbi:D-isomer specific 2-hydroxyacid dehydrogenase [Chytriomyces sp. MP71]|nr:D-isomer specific 2-hydroxyacid dehydrogenase [Chytriomyces sp. MP71]
MRHEIKYLKKAADRHGAGLETQMLNNIKLSPETVDLAKGAAAVSVFVNDHVDSTILTRLNELGVKHVATRSAGFNHIDTVAAKHMGIAVSRVPAYSPHSVAEFAVALILAANRRVVTAASRIKQGNFSLTGLVGFDLHGKTVGVVGTGKIGQCFIKIMLGFGCRILCHDPFPSPEVAAWPNVTYAPLDTLFTESHVLSLHCPLTPETKHLINEDSLDRMRDGVLLVNTSRGGLIDSLALIRALKVQRVGAAGLDVYEHEADMFFEDHMDAGDAFFVDKSFARLLSFQNVVITGHQGFLTHEALERIMDTLFLNVRAFLLLSPDTDEEKSMRKALAGNLVF